MKKFIVSIFALLAVNAAVMAQDNVQDRPQRMDRTEMVKQRTEMMVKQYGLNEEQAAALLALNEKNMPKMRGPRPGGGPMGGNGQQMRRQRPERNDSVKGDFRRQGGERRGGGFDREAYNTELQKIMTPEQFKAYQADMEKMRSNRPQRGMGQN